MQSGMQLYDLDAWTQPQVKCIAEHDLRSEAGELHWSHRLDCAVGANWHEYRCFNDTVGQDEPAAACGTTLRDDGKFHRADCSSGLRVGLMLKQHGVAIAEKAIALAYRVRVRRTDRVVTRERRHQHEQRGTRQMEVGEKAIHYPEAVTRRDEQVGLACECRDGALFTRRRLERPQRGRPDCNDASIRGASCLDRLSRRFGNDESLVVHPMLRELLVLHREEGARSDMQTQIADRDSPLADPIEQWLIEVKTCGGSRDCARLASVDRLVAICVV